MPLLTLLLDQIHGIHIGDRTCFTQNLATFIAECKFDEIVDHRITQVRWGYQVQGAVQLIMSPFEVVVGWFYTFQGENFYIAFASAAHARDPYGCQIFFDLLFDRASRR